ncbi:MAG TPA: polysaccharide deacetylase family protein [Patescibacteria group bacterium]|nr:polysaccharide deacetylase family protein [Patescibacteria group bacterium]
MVPELKFASSWDDGSEFDGNIMELLMRYKLPGTFYLPGVNPKSDMVMEYIENGFEVGAHTATHPADLKLLDDTLLRNEIVINKHALEKIIGRKVTKFCYPRGRYDERAIAILKELGFTEARTTVVLKTAWDDPFRTDTAIHVFQRGEYEDRDWANIAARMVRQAAELNEVFHIWGHGWEIERDKNWDKLNGFFSWLTENYKIISI